ncbi:hypothetical protein K6025_03145 [Ehrlichia sp. JZT12]
MKIVKKSTAIVNLNISVIIIIDSWYFVLSGYVTEVQFLNVLEKSHNILRSIAIVFGKVALSKKYEVLGMLKNDNYLFL